MTITGIKSKITSKCIVILNFLIYKGLDSYPVALEASAELRDSLALISMMQYSRDSG